MNENKNKYILVEEFSILLKKIPEKYNSLRSALVLIYEQGYKINEALNESRFNKNIRTAERIVRKYSNNLICMSDLRRSYLFSNPHKISYFNPRKLIRDRISPRLRWRILCRDGFRCLACGRSSKEIILHIDHKIPSSLGGETNIENLRALCGGCNMGRGTLMLEVEDRN